METDPFNGETQVKYRTASNKAFAADRKKPRPLKSNVMHINRRS